MDEYAVIRSIASRNPLDRGCAVIAWALGIVMSGFGVLLFVVLAVWVLGW